MFSSKKSRNIFIILILSFQVNIISCDFRGCISRDALTLGTIVSNYPEWCTGLSVEQVGINSLMLCYGYSPWMEWQSEDGVKLHDFVDDGIVSDDYSGKFRILLLSQHVYICFNDSNSTHALFYNYYGDYDDGREISIPQKSSEKFEYEAWFRPYHLTGVHGYVVFDESCKDSNRSSIIMEKKSDTSFSYTLTVAGKEIIDVNMSNYSSDFGAADVGVPDADIRNQYWWIPDSFYEIDGGDDISLYYKDGKISVRRPMENTFYSFEGISLRDINETKMTVSSTCLMPVRVILQIISNLNLTI